MDALRGEGADILRLFVALCNELAKDGPAGGESGPPLGWEALDGD